MSQIERLWKAARELELSDTDTLNAVRIIERAGLYSAGGEASGGADVSRPKARQSAAPAPAPEREEAPLYNPADIAAGMNQNPDFRALVREFENLLGKVLGAPDMQLLYAMYDWRGLPPGVLLLLAHHCVAETAARLGPGRKPTMRQMDKEAAYWETRGLLTEELAEAFLRQREQSRTLIGQYMQKLQIKGRDATASEHKYLDEWALMGFEPEVVYRAYDLTMVKTGKMVWKYCDAILRSWHEQNLHTADSMQKAAASDTDKPGDPYERMLMKIRGES
jgi:DnaD/phage-associated family protein